jgi:1-hydroxycarotenoid 3,4-desaturase
MEPTYDSIVVGAGVGGLAAAITLASEGQKVLVLEAADGPGGKASALVLEGVEVDTGPSVLTLPFVFQQLIARAGLDPARELVLRKPQPSFRYLYEDGTALDIHHELADTLASVERTLGASAAAELSEFMRYAGRIWDAAAPVFVFGQAPSLGGLLGMGFTALSALSRIDPLSTMQGAIDARVRSPHLRMLLARYATYNGSDVRRAPATLNCIAHVELALGGFGVEGGMFALVQALMRAATKLGVEFRFSSPVERVQVERGSVQGVVSRGALLSARSVVLNADVAHAAQDLLTGTRSPLRAPGEPSMSGYTAIYRARRRDRAAHTVLFPADYGAEFRDLFDRQAPPTDPTVYLCAQEVCHGRPGWQEYEPLFVMVNVPPEPAEGSSSIVWPELRKHVHQKLVAKGLVDDDDRVLWERSSVDLAQRFPRSRGSLYGAASNGKSSAFQRPKNAVDAIRGLYLASGSAHPGGGLPLAAQSGCAAAALILAERASLSA